MTEYEQPHEFIRRLFDRPGVRAVAGLTLTIASNASWEQRSVAEALIQATSAAFGVEAFVLLMAVTPNVVVA